MARRYCRRPATGGSSPKSSVWEVRSVPSITTDCETPITNSNSRSLTKHLAGPFQVFARAQIIRWAKFLGNSFALHEDQFLAFDDHLARPDFLLTRFGLVIEIDGYIHLTTAKMRLDEFAEGEVYAGLGLRVYRVTVDDLVSDRGRIHFAKALKAILSSPLTQNEAAALRMRISRHRNARASGNDIFALNFRRWRDQEQRNHYKNLVHYQPHKAWGGTTTNIAPIRNLTR